MKKIIRTTIIIVVVVIIGVVGYKVFFKKSAAVPAADSSGLATTAGVGAVATPGVAAGATSPDDTGGLGQEFLTLLLNVRSIKLDDTVFSSPAFLSLQDFSRPILPDTNPGRPNPFAPIGIDGTITSTQISTSNPSSVTSTGSTLNGSLTVGGSDVMRWFQYGTTDAMNMQTTPEPQANPGSFIETVSGLLPNTTYYAKAVAMDGGQTLSGNVVTWTTAQASKK